MNNLTTNPPTEQPDSENWRDIDISTPNGRNYLNRVVLTRLGWRVVVGERFDYKYARRYPPNGERSCIFWARNWSNYISAAWNVAVPHYTTDANAALKLAAQIPLFSLCNYADAESYKWTASYKVESPRYGWFIKQQEYANTPAIAICFAWLAWSEDEMAQVLVADTRRADGESGVL